jgi:hypothetical protein
LTVNPEGLEMGQQGGDLAMSHQRFSPDEGYVQRAIPLDEREDPVDELAAPEIGHLLQAELATQVVRSVRVAARAREGTLFRDFDREGWNPP